MNKTLRTLALSASLAVGAGLVTVSPVAAPSALAQSSGSSRGTPLPPPNTVEFGPDREDGPLVVSVVGDILGRGISEDAGFLVGDLGIMVDLDAGEEFIIVFGDSWRGPRFGQGTWMSPVGVLARLDADGRIEILRPLNEGEVARQLIGYSHDGGITVIPSDVINIDGTLYMQGMWNRGLGNVLRTEIWKSDDRGATWRSVATTPAGHMDGLGNLLTWDMGPDGYVYVMSSQFRRSDDVYLSRFLPAQIADRTTWEHFNSRTGVWTSSFPRTPILSDEVSAGEMSLRFIEGNWVLAMFNAATYSIEVRITDDITTDWNAITPAQVVIGGGWGAPQGPDNFAQVYGGYIVPGSTIGSMDLVVSQWNTRDNSRYNSTQFHVQGLDEFFGISPAPRGRMAPQTVPQDRVGDQSVIRVQQTEVTDSVLPY
ncbi:DUF4185 domain-containing protein [Corynebacterium sp.]|uniref:DUF4185 domain-containing protein n=1 Tax=Corynebacterium sp. TaxID=1720 RepID=UPI0026DEC77E|nr:DUF4185 domain-containing protein [Corynebacterium sp.]MDO5513253.1 DUF4185 domain-containing protein [Corynebacterium sp.]